ncbi:hypothetical protein BMS3Abin15_01188 [bacterium BMS3Abin15]|nr:hypothetical protein BMS3Abin15_01188 [bacterium BMS3Abin15]
MLVLPTAIKIAGIRFFKLFKLYFPVQLASEILLVTNAEQYSDPELNIRTITTNKRGEKTLSWGKRMSIALEMANQDIVLILAEDFFLRSEGNEQKFKQLIDLIYKHSEIDHIRLRKGPWHKKKSKFEDLDLIKRWTKYRVVMFPGLWRKEVLKKHLFLSESPWELEILGSLRASVLNYKFYSITKEFITRNGPIFNCHRNGGIIKGKWNKNNVVDLFAQNDIKIDYSLRGFHTPADRKKDRITLRKNILTSFRNILKTMIFIGSHLMTFKN